MARWAPAKKDTLEVLADEILHNYGTGRSMVAIDGLSHAGTAEFADALADALRDKGKSVFRASIRDFLRPRSDRERDARLSKAAFYDDAFDYSLLRRILIDPFRASGSTGFVLAGFDEKRDQPVHQPKWMTAGPDALLLLDGVFLNRPELAGLWNYSIWVSASALTHAEEASDSSGSSSAGSPGRPEEDAGEARYLDVVDPSEKASAIIDNSDPEHPRRVFADSC